MPSADNLRAMDSLPEYRRRLLIDTNDGPRPLAYVADDWQRKDFEAIDTGWMRVAGHRIETAKQRAYLERSRGHAKTSDAAVMVTYPLSFSRKPVKGVAAAADMDQAKLLRDAVDRLVRLNPWLATILKVDQWKVTNTRTGSTLEIISSDAPTSYGLTPDFVIIDELTNCAHPSFGNLCFRPWRSGKTACWSSSPMPAAAWTRGSTRSARPHAQIPLGTFTAWPARRRVGLTKPYSRSRKNTSPNGFPPLVAQCLERGPRGRTRSRRRRGVRNSDRATSAALANRTGRRKRLDVHRRPGHRDHTRSFGSGCARQQIWARARAACVVSVMETAEGWQGPA